MTIFNFKTFPVLSTKRLILRQLNTSDANYVFKLRTDKEVNKFIERPPERQDKNGQIFIDRINKSIAENKVIYWVISLKEKPKLIGTICLWNFSEDKKTAEIGYDLATANQGKGIMSEAIKTVINYGFNTLNFKTIEAFTHKNNLASINLLTKHNFKMDKSRKDSDNKNNIIFIKENINK